MEILKGQFKIQSIDKDGRIDPKISRAILTNAEQLIEIDYHAILFSLIPTDIIDIVLYSGDNQQADPNIPEDYVYAMAGVCYEVVKQDNKNVYHISCGGLLIRIESGCC